MVTILRANYPTTGVAPADPDPPPQPTGATFSLAINPDFDPDSPVLKNGQLLTGAALQTWKGIDWLIRNHRARRYVQNGGSSVDSLAARDDLYHYARTLACVYGELFTVLRLTGDARVLDELVRIWLIQKAKLHVGYRNPDTGAKYPTHPYRQWAWDEASSLYRGTDYHPLDNIRTHTPITQLLLALRENEAASSPAGYDYEAIADDLEDYLRDWVKAWQGPEADLGLDADGNPASGWSANYRGNLHEIYRDDVGARPGAGQWPIHSRHHAHTHVGASAAHVWLGLAIPDFAAAATVGLAGFTDLFFERNTFHYTGAYGDQALWPRSLHDTGHGELGSGGPGNYAEPSVYLELFWIDIHNLWLQGLIPDYPTVFAQPITRTLNQYTFSGLTTSQGMQADVLAGQSKTGASAPARLVDGATLDFITAAGQPGVGAPRSNANLVHASLCQLQAWDTPDDRMEEHVWDRMGRSTLFYDSGGTPISRPRVLSPSIGLLLKQVGAKDWVLDANA